MAELVHQQVGFEVVVLDSKCFPIIECESTTSMEFWKSNRRVLVASKALYKKLGGSSTSLSSTNDEIHLTHSDEEVTNPPQPKRCCLSENKKNWFAWKPSRARLIYPMLFLVCLNV